MKKFKCFILIGLLIFSNDATYASTFEQLSVKQQQHVAINASEDAINCTVYFSVFEKCLLNTPNTTKELLDKAKSAKQNSQETMLLFSTIAGMNHDAVNLRISETAEEFGDKMNHNCSNISILRKEYFEKCVAMINNPENSLNYWIKKLSY